MDLTDIGLALAFENAPSVRSVTDDFIRRTLAVAYPGYTSFEAGFSDVTNEPNLFSVGHSQIFMNASCGSACSFDFSIRDWFKEPIGTGNGELGGTPYRINHNWHRTSLYP